MRKWSRRMPKSNWNWLLSADGEQAYDMLGDPMDWDFSSAYVAVHTPTGLAIWVANGASMFTGFPAESKLPPFSFGLLERLILSGAYKRARAANRVLLRVRGSGA